MCTYVFMYVYMYKFTEVFVFVCNYVQPLYIYLLQRQIIMSSQLIVISFVHVLLRQLVCYVVTCWLLVHAWTVYFMDAYGIHFLSYLIFKNTFNIYIPKSFDLIDSSRNLYIFYKKKILYEFWDKFMKDFCVLKSDSGTEKNKNKQTK